MEYRIEHDSMGEVRVPADRLWNRDHAPGKRALVWHTEEGGGPGQQRTCGQPDDG